MEKLKKYMMKGCIMCSGSQIDVITKEMVDCYKRYYGENIIGIFLYGSYARGDFDSESDIDITAIVKGDRMELQEKLKQVWDVSADIGLENDIVISPTVIPYDEFEKYKTILPYYMNIAKEGKKIG